MKIIVYLTAVLLISSLIGNFVVRPLTLQWQQLKFQIIEQQAELSKNLSLLKQKDEIKSAYAALRGCIKQQGSEEQELSSFLSEVEKHASASGIHIVSLKPRPVKQQSFCKKYILEMDCSATVEKYINFIYQLHIAEQLIRVEKLRLVSQGSNSATIKAELLITKVQISE